MLDFSGQRVVITGADRGIGKGIAELFLEAGASIIGLYHSHEEAVKEFLNHHQAQAERIDFQQVDVSDYQQVENFFLYLEKKYSTFQILVNNSGIRKDAVVGMMKETEWKSVLEVNLSGTFYMCKLAVRFFLSQRYGRIINITSPSGKIGFAGQANYAASKAGLVALTKSLAKEVATRGITANCVSPGFTDTDFIKDLSTEQLKKYLAEIPIKRLATPREVAQAVIFLASPEASYITGTTLEVTGGL